MGNAGRVNTALIAAHGQPAIARTDAAAACPRSSCGTTASQWRHCRPNWIAARPIPLAPPGTDWAPISAVFSAHAERIELCLFDPAGRREIARFDLPECTDEIWHGYLPERAHWSDLRLSRPRTLQSAGRTPFQSAQAVARSLRQAVCRRRCAGPTRCSAIAFNSPRADLSYDRRDSARAC